jgi:prolipoprotein diacylglyceryltransferase
MERFFIEFLRINPKVAFDLSGAQLLSVVSIAGGAIWMFLSFRSQRQTVSAKTK